MNILQLAYGWIRELSPIQPLTSGVWGGDLTNPTPLQKFQLEQSDIVRTLDLFLSNVESHLDHLSLVRSDAWSSEPGEYSEEIWSSDRKY